MYGQKMCIHFHKLYTIARVIVYDFRNIKIIYLPIHIKKKSAFRYGMFCEFSRSFLKRYKNTQFKAFWPDMKILFACLLYKNYQICQQEMEYASESRKIIATGKK